LDEFIASLEGTGECDILKSFYEGTSNSNIYAGWRDLMADRSAYFITKVTFAIILNE